MHAYPKKITVYNCHWYIYHNKFIIIGPNSAESSHMRKSAKGVMSVFLFNVALQLFITFLFILNFRIISKNIAAFYT